MKKTLFALALCTAASGALAQSTFTTSASHAYLMDFDTGAVLLDKKGDELMAPASMSKLMTAYVVFDKLKQGQLSLEDEFTVSENAWRKGGSKSGSSTMFLDPNSSVKVGDLLKGVIIQSGNDACITLAENLAGSEDNFAAEMTIKAREIGLEKSTFKNATGWPNKEHLMTAHELAMLARKIIREFPEYYPLYAEKSFKYNGINQENRNPLLYSMPEQADGMKTGHTEKSGYGLVGSAKSMDGDRRLILVINGLKTMKERGQEAKKILDWGFREFDNYTFYTKGSVVEQIPVWMGEVETVPGIVDENIIVTMKRLDYLKKKVTLIYDAPIKAPIDKGQRLGTLRISLPSGENYDFPVVAGESVGKVGYFGKLKAVFMYMLSGKGE